VLERTRKSCSMRACTWRDKLAGDEIFHGIRMADGDRYDYNQDTLIQDIHHASQYYLYAE